MIQARHLTKRYGPTVAVRDLSFEVLPGRVTGFLGPNGAGKSTTMRMILGLDASASGEVTVNGIRYREPPTCSSPKTPSTTGPPSLPAAEHERQQRNMTTTDLARRPASGPADVLRCEWTKLRTVRSTWWSLLAVLAGMIAIGLLICASIAARWDQLPEATRASFDPTLRSLSGLFAAQLATGVLGVLAITSEYATGMIRATLTAVPRRRTVLAAKAAVLTVLAFVVSTVACAAAFLVGQAILAAKGIGVSITSPGELRAVIGAGLYLTVLALLGLGLGAVLRHTTGAISAFTGLVLILPLLVTPLPSPWGHDITKYLPANAGQAILNIHPTPGSLAPWTGFAVLCAWVLAALATAAWLINRRDA
jgi:energy-coupling factor transporter ATP-binding protein EcfA2